MLEARGFSPSCPRDSSKAGGRASNKQVSRQLRAIWSCWRFLCRRPGWTPTLPGFQNFLAVSSSPSRHPPNLLVRGARLHPLQAVVTEEPLRGEKPRPGGALSAQPLPREQVAFVQPPLPGLGRWGPWDGARLWATSFCGFGRPLLLEPEASPCKMGVVR